jgi:hypothetical protein
MADPTPAETDLDQEEIGRRSRETWPAWTASPSPFAAPAAPWRINWSLPPAEAAAAPATAPPAPPVAPPDPTKAPPQFWGPGTIAGSKPPPPGSDLWLRPWRSAEATPPTGVQTASTGEPGEAGVLAPSPPTAAPILEDRATRAGIAPAVAQAAVNAVTTPAAPTATAPPKPGVAFDVVGPEATRARFDRMEAAQAEQERLFKERETLLKPLRDQRAATEAGMKAALDEWQKGLQAARPTPPEVGKELTRIPAPPDVKIRPWLDPEGKDALSVIVQSLGMLAVAATGISQKAPLTAMKYFREAAENWRRDEVDAASSKFKQFEMAVMQIKDNNELALKQYELADQQYGHNLAAKQAMVTVALDRLNLQDHAVEAAAKPFDEAMAMTKDRLKAVLEIQAEANKYTSAEAALQKNKAALPTTKIGLAGVVAGAEQALQDPTLTPEQRLDITRRRDLAQQTLGDVRKADVADAQAKNLNITQNRIVAKEFEDATKLNASAEFVKGRVTDILDDYMTVQKWGGLAQNQNWFNRYVAAGKRATAVNMPPEVSAAIARIEQFWPQVNVSEARLFLDDKGIRTKEAFGPLAGGLRPYPDAVGIIKGWLSMIADVQARARATIRTRGALMGSAPTPEETP